MLRCARQPLTSPFFNQNGLEGGAFLATVIQIWTTPHAGSNVGMWGINGWSGGGDPKSWNLLNVLSQQTDERLSAHFQDSTKVDSGALARAEITSLPAFKFATVGIAGCPPDIHPGDLTSGWAATRSMKLSTKARRSVSAPCGAFGSRVGDTLQSPDSLNQRVDTACRLLIPAPVFAETECTVR